MVKSLLAALIFCACLFLGACASIPAGGSPGPAAAAVAFELGVQARCPRDNRELAVLIGARIAFDLSIGKDLSDGQREIVAAARAETNRICGLVEAPPEPAPAEPGSSA
jgi:hypothetical protein